MLGKHGVSNCWVWRMKFTIKLPVLAILLFAFAPLSLAGVAADGPGGVPGRLWYCNEILDELGNIYAYGTFTDSLQIGPHAIVSQNQISFFIARLTPAGEWEWVRTIPGAGTTLYALDLPVSINDAGSLLLTGPFEARGTSPVTVIESKLLYSTATLNSHGEWIAIKQTTSDAHSIASEGNITGTRISPPSIGDESPSFGNLVMVSYPWIGDP